MRAVGLIEVQRNFLNEVILAYHGLTDDDLCVNVVDRSKNTVPSIAQLSAGPASETVLDCWTIHAATSLLTNEVWAPVSKRVAAEYDGLSSTVTQHMRYVV